MIEPTNDYTLPYWVMVQNPEVSGSVPAFYSGAPTAEAAEELALFMGAKAAEETAKKNASRSRGLSPRQACVYSVKTQDVAWVQVQLEEREESQEQVFAQ